MNFPHGYFARVTFVKESKTYEIYFPDFPTVFTVADDLEQAQEMALEALSAALAGLMQSPVERSDLKFPSPRAQSRGPLVSWRSLDFARA